MSIVWFWIDCIFLMFTVWARAQTLLISVWFRFRPLARVWRIACRSPQHDSRRCHPQEFWASKHKPLPTAGDVTRAPELYQEGTKHTHTHRHIPKHTHKCLNTPTHTNTHRYTNTLTPKHTHTHPHTHTHAHALTHTHTHTHTQSDCLSRPFETDG